MARGGACHDGPGDTRPPSPMSRSGAKGLAGNKLSPVRQRAFLVEPPLLLVRAGEALCHLRLRPRPRAAPACSQEIIRLRRRIVKRGDIDPQQSPSARGTVRLGRSPAPTKMSTPCPLASRGPANAHSPSQRRPLRQQRLRAVESKPGMAPAKERLVPGHRIRAARAAIGLVGTR